MKRFYAIIILIVVALPVKVFAQALPPLQPEQDACGALQLCGSTFYTPYSYSGKGLITEYTWTTGNCFAETNSVWFKLKVAVAGNIVFTIQPDDTTNDYDFTVFDVTNDTCSNIPIMSNIRCNGNTIIPLGSTPGGIIGLNYTSTVQFVPGGTVGSPFCQFISANAGDEYLLMVDNFSASAAGFTLDFAGTTAIFDQGVLPEIASESHTCDNSKIVIKLNKPVQCASIAANGSDFNISPNGSIASAVGLNCTPTAGYTDEIEINFTAPLIGGTYTLTAQNGTDANTLLDNCNGAMLVGEDIVFNMPPATNPQIVRLDTPACSQAIIVLSHRVKCSSVSTNGSEFVISGPDNIKVLLASPMNCDVNGLADSILLVFDRSPKNPGVFTLSMKQGSDGDGIVDTCNFPVNNTIDWAVSDRGFLSPTATPPLLCEEGYVQLNSNPAVLMTDFQWNTGMRLSDSTIENPLAYLTETTTLKLEGKDPYGCYRRNELSIIVSERFPTVTTNIDTVICIGDEINISAAGGQSYHWIPSDGLSCDNCSNPVAQPQQTTTYAIVITDGYGCSDTLYKTIIVNPLPLVDVGNDVEIDFGESVQIGGVAPGAYSYTWYPINGLDNPVIPNPIASPEVTTVYILSVLDTNKCLGNDSLQVTVRMDKAVNIPSAFSPNGDGRNDMFRVVGWKYHRMLEFRVFNRWGNEVFNATDNSGWDGTFKGVPCDIGSYSYLIRIAFPDGVEKTFTGTVSLIR